MTDIQSRLQIVFIPVKSMEKAAESFSLSKAILGAACFGYCLNKTPSGTSIMWGNLNPDWHL